MLKNIKIGVKLIVVGTLIMVIPLLVVAVMAITKSTQGLSTVENEQLVGRASDIAQMIDKVFEEEKKLALSFSIDPDIVAAANAVSAKTPVEAEETPAEKPAAGKGASAKTAPVASAEGGVAVGGGAANRATAKLNHFIRTQGLGESYQVLLCIGTDGVSFAASDPSFVNVDVSGRGYFKTAMEGTVNVGEAGLNTVTKKPFAPFAAPIRSGDKIVGVFAAIADISFLNELIAGKKVGTTGYAFVTDKTGLVMAHPKVENIFTTNMSTLKGMEDVSKRMMAGEEGVATYVFQGVEKAAGYSPVKATGWSVALTLPESEYLKAATELRTLILLISVIAVVLAFLIYFMFSRTITTPLVKGVAFAELVASGDFTQQLPIHQTDEIGRLAEALNGMSVKLKGMVGTIQDSAEQVASSSEQITSSAQKLAEGAQSQASTLEETSASVEELDRVGGPGGGARPEPVRGRGAGLQLDGAGARVHRRGVQEPQGDRRSCRQVRGQRAGRGQGGERGRGRHQPHCRKLGEDRRDRQRHLGYRGPDQPPGAERLHRGGARRRARPRLRGGCGGSEQAGGAQLLFHQGDREPDPGKRPQRHKGSGDGKGIPDGHGADRDRIPEGPGNDRRAVGVHDAAGGRGQGAVEGAGQRGGDEPEHLGGNRGTDHQRQAGLHRRWRT